MEIIELYIVKARGVKTYKLRNVFAYEHNLLRLQTKVTYFYLIYSNLNLWMTEQGK